MFASAVNTESSTQESIKVALWRFQSTAIKWWCRHSNNTQTWTDERQQKEICHHCVVPTIRQWFSCCQGWLYMAFVAPLKPKNQNLKQLVEARTDMFLPTGGAFNQVAGEWGFCLQAGNDLICDLNDRVESNPTRLLKKKSKGAGTRHCYLFFTKPRGLWKISHFQAFTKCTKCTTQLLSPVPHLSPPPIWRSQSLGPGCLSAEATGLWYGCMSKEWTKDQGQFWSVNHQHQRNQSETILAAPSSLWLYILQSSASRICLAASVTAANLSHHWTRQAGLRGSELKDFQRTGHAVMQSVVKFQTCLDDKVSSFKIRSKTLLQLTHLPLLQLTCWEMRSERVQGVEISTGKGPPSVTVTVTCNFHFRFSHLIEEESAEMYRV